MVGQAQEQAARGTCWSPGGRENAAEAWEDMDLFHQREVIKTLMSIAARTATSKLDGYHVLAAGLAW